MAQGVDDGFEVGGGGSAASTEDAKLELQERGDLASHGFRCQRIHDLILLLHGKTRMGLGDKW